MHFVLLVYFSIQQSKMDLIWQVSVPLLKHSFPLFRHTRLSCTHRFEAAHSRLGQRTRRSRGHQWQRRPAHAARVRDRGGADASASRRSGVAHRHVDAVMSDVCGGRQICVRRAWHDSAEHGFFSIFRILCFTVYVFVVVWRQLQIGFLFIIHCYFRHHRTKEYIFHTCT